MREAQPTRQHSDRATFYHAASAANPQTEYMRIRRVRLFLDRCGELFRHGGRQELLHDTSAAVGGAGSVHARAEEVQIEVKHLCTLAGSPLSHMLLARKLPTMSCVTLNVGRRRQ